MNELTNTSNHELSSDINTITAEINAYQQVAGEAIFEIGRRLKHVKENDLAHGEFGKWLAEVEIDRTLATRLMRIVTELDDGKYATSHNIGIETLYQIATLPPEHREVAHTTAKGEQKTPDEMTVRELRELKRQLREAEQAKEQAEIQAEMARKSEQIAIDKYEELAERESRVNSEVFEELDGVRVVDKDSRKEFYREFSEDLNYIVKKYGSLSYEGQDLRGLAEEESEVGRNIDAFDDFWKALSRSIMSEEQNIIVEMERC